MKIALAALLAAALLACTQDPLFYDIYMEYPPIEPLIEGSPTKIVDDGTRLFVANANGLWEYNHTAGKTWVNRGRGGGAQIKAIACAFGSLIFVLDTGGEIYLFDPYSRWIDLMPIEGFQQIYGTSNGLFAGNGLEVWGLTLGGSPPVITLSLAQVPNASGLLSGAASIGGTDYVSTRGGGIWKADGTAIPGVGAVAGMIANGGELIAVSPTRTIYRHVDNTGGTQTTVSTGWSFSGALALWPDTSPTTLLLGMGGYYGNNTSGTYRYGYREIDLSGSRAADPGDDSGGRATSVDPGARYSSDIGKHPVNALAVIPGSDSGDGAGRPIVLASTQQKGVWSYKVRRGSPQWNGEDN